MIFIETPVFTKRVKALLDDAEYALFQSTLIENPKAGAVIEGTGGIRKVRVAAKGHGRRGGARVVYFHFESAHRIAMLMIYPKSQKDALTAREKKILKAIIDRWSQP